MARCLRGRGVPGGCARALRDRLGSEVLLLGHRGWVGFAGRQTTALAEEARRERMELERRGEAGVPFPEGRTST